MAAIRPLETASLLGRRPSVRGVGGSSRGSGTRNPGTNTATSPMLAGRLLIALASSGLELKHPILQILQLQSLRKIIRSTRHEN